MRARRLVLLALLLLVVPAAVTALFLARHARPAVEPDAQPGGRVEGRLVARGAAAPIAASAADGGARDALAGATIVLLGVARDGALRELARATTGADGAFAFDAPALDGHYAARLEPGAWMEAVVPFSLAHGAPRAVVVPAHVAAELELEFECAAAGEVSGGAWTIEGQAARSWFSPWRGARFTRSGRLAGARLEVGGLPPVRVTVRVRFEGGDATELEIDLAPGRNRRTIRL